MSDTTIVPTTFEELQLLKDRLSPAEYTKRLEDFIIEHEIEQEKPVEWRESDITPLEFFNNLRDILFLVNDHGKFEFVSDTWHKLLGWNREETLGEPLSKFIHQEDLSTLSKRVNHILKDQLNDNDFSEFRIKRKDGGWTILSAQGKFFTKNKRNYVIGSARVIPITTKKLIENLSELSLVASKTQSLVLILDSDYKIKWVNESFTNRTGYDLIDVFDIEAHKLLIDSLNIKSDLMRFIRNFQKKKAFSLNLYLKDKGGNKILVDVNITPVKDDDGNILKHVAILTDLSQLEQAEQELLEERNTLQNVIDRIPSLVFLKNIKSERTMVNDSDVAFQGAKNKADLIGKSDYDLYSRELAEKFVEQDKEIIRTGIPLKNHLVEVNRDGNQFYYQLSKFPLTNYHGNNVGIIGIGTDITEMKINENELQKNISIISDQNKRLKHFTYIVSHNIRSHAANIFSLANIVCDSSTEELEYHSMLKQSCGYLLETLDNLNEVLAIQENTSIEKKDINLYSIANKVIELLHTEIEGSNTLIQINIDHNATVHYNLAYLESVLLNLITNAIKYRNNAIKSKVNISFEDHQNEGVLTVSDNGLGIDLSRHGERLFGMYQTFHKHPKAKGIGLYLIKNQVESMGGKIHVDSEVMKGTTFTVTFPK